jgi:putative sigma-54 modulation protein
MRRWNNSNRSTSAPIPAAGRGGALTILFMVTEVRAVQFKASNRLVDFTHKRLERINQVYQRAIHATVFFRIDNNHLSDNKIAEVTVHIPGEDLVVRKEAKTFEKALSLAVDRLRRLASETKAKTKKLRRSH